MSLSPHLLVLSQTLWEGIVNSVQYDHPLSRQLLRTIFMEAVLDEHVELVSEALLEKVAEAICDKLKRQIDTKKYKFFCTKFRIFCASLFWDLYPLCAVRCTVQLRAHLGLRDDHTTPL